MPKGVYKRTSWHRAVVRKAMNQPGVAKRRRSSWLKTYKKDTKFRKKLLSVLDKNHKEMKGKKQTGKRLKTSRKTLAKIHRSRIGTHYSKRWKESMSAGQKKFYKTRGAKKTLRERTLRLWANPEYRKKVTKAQNTEKANKNRRIAMKKTNKKIWNDESYVRKMHQALKCNRRKNGVYGPSKIHLSIFRGLCRAGIKGIKMEYLIPPYCVDIAFPRKKVAIEIDGKLWHSDKAREKERDESLRSLGWKVLHVPAKRSCGQRLIEAIKTGGVDYACSSSPAILLI